MEKLENDMSRIGAASRKYFEAPHHLYIDGQFVSPVSGEQFPVVDPTTASEFSKAPLGSANDIDRAVKAARKAFDTGPWPRFTGPQRERCLLKLADLLERDATEFSEIESVNSGRTLTATRLFDVNLSVDYLRYMAGWATKISGQTLRPSVPYVPNSNFFAMTLREPVGVVAAITPWNVPLGQAIWKIAPALATGCTLVLKPAEQTPLTALRFAQLAAEADLPPGVLNIVTGFGQSAGAALVSHPEVDKISFTGSTPVGQRIGVLAASRMKRYTLELGGKSPMVVLEDADLESTIAGTAMGIFANHGQNCCAGSRLFVHEKIYDEVVAGIARIAANIRLGSPLEPSTQMGPLISASQRDRVFSYIQSGQEEGAQLLIGGTAPPVKGSYIHPTILTGVAPSMRMVREEIFGPVLAATKFSDLNDVVSRANDTEFGLGASVWTRNLSQAHWFIQRLRAGTVWVNTHGVLDLAVPFGGIKQSGVGHELGEESVNQHTRLKAAILSL